MNTQELRNKIDSTLGNSLRVLLPSYWWKKLFHAVVDEIDDVRNTVNSKASKSEVASLSNSVDALSDKVDNIDSGNKITVDSELSLESTNPVQNKVVATEIIKRKGCTCYVTDKYTGSEYEEVVKRNVEAYSAWLLSAQLGSLDTWSILNESWGNNLYTAQKVTYSFYNILMYVLVEGNIEIYKLSNDGTCVYVGKESPSSAGGLETRSFKSTNSTTDKEWNRNTVNLFLEGKANIVYSFNNAGLPEGTGGELMLNAHIYQDGNHRFCFFEQHPSGGYTDHGIIIQSDGTYDDDVEVFKPATEMSDTSTSPVQNKVIKKYVDTEVAKKVDKVSGKGLSTEDFTTLLKTKLEGLENYDDTTLTNAINSLETRLNTLVSGDTSTAIESFNEVVAFLENLTDTQDLSSIIASIEQQINAKQAKINDLEDIRSGASLGKTSLQEHQDISHLATKEELQNVVDDVLETEEVYAAAVNDLNSRLVETNAAIDTEISTRESLATEVQTLINRVTSNEEVTATSYNELNERINNNYQEGVDTYATKVELNNEIASINTAIIENEEVIAATLNDLLSQIEALRVRIEQLENA